MGDDISLPRRDLHVAVMDVAPADFNVGGEFAALRQRLCATPFNELIECECRNVSSFLDEWQRQLLAVDPRASLLSRMSMRDLFRVTPQLSGVLYLSSNIIVSEALWDDCHEGVTHPTSREVAAQIQAALPWTSELTFSFPRKYDFFGYLNSWGFIRFPRLDDSGNGAGVLTSCTTMDPRVMQLLRRTGAGSIIHRHNAVWFDAVHDFLHQVVLYTNPSFGIGRRSPMSIAGAHDPVDAWGVEMVDTFNYEYWAHRSHRCITSALMTQDWGESIAARGVDYVRAVFDFHSLMLASKIVAKAEAERIAAYLIAIYLWPLNVLLHPQSLWIEKIATRIDDGPFRPSRDPVADVVAILRSSRISESADRATAFSTGLGRGLPGILRFMEEAASPIERGVAGILRVIGVENWRSATPRLSWYQRLRLQITVTGYRGLYEGWFHDHPVRWNGGDVDPHMATLKFLPRLDETWSKFAANRPAHYTLAGIEP